MDMLPVKDAATMLKISEQQVRTLLRSGALEGRQIGKQWITTEAAILLYAKSGGFSPPEDRQRASGRLPEIKALSFFSGAMGLDLGLEKAGIDLLLACESDKACRRTISANRPDIALLGDIWKYNAGDIRKAARLAHKDEIDVIVGGPPCQAFSTAGARRGVKDTRGNALIRFIDLILDLRPKFAVIENVRGLMSAPMNHTPHAERTAGWELDQDGKPGGVLLHVLDILRGAGFGVSFNLYNSANFGVPQSRERLILLCSRDGNKLPHLIPTHSQDGSYGLPKWRTLREALQGLDSTVMDHAEFPEERLRFYRMLKPGQYWKHLPTNLHREALGASLDSGGGKTGFLRRLDWDKPSCTLVTSPCMPATDICHPTEHRPISVQEYKRIQQFPDDWIVCGSTTDQYRQIGNAVPVGLGEAVGRAILTHIAGKDKIPPPGFPFSRYKGTDEVTWEKRTRVAMRPNETSSCVSEMSPKRRRKIIMERDEHQLVLFADT